MGTLVPTSSSVSLDGKLSGVLPVGVMEIDGDNECNTDVNDKYNQWCYERPKTPLKSRGVTFVTRYL